MIEIGQKFNRWTVIADSEQKYFIKCQCDCGTVRDINQYNLRSNQTKCCGCKRGGKIGLRHTYNNLYSEYRSSARKRSLDFEIDVDFLKEISQQNCYYCGVEPFNVYNPFLKKDGSYRKGYEVVKNKDIEYVESCTIKYNGLDRQDNSKGYIKENIVPCCWICNKAKVNISNRDFINWIQRIKNG